MESLQNLPPAPKKGTQLPHQGQYSEQELDGARDKGYVPVDIRFSGSTYLALQGMIMGTVSLSEDQLRALELRARLEKAGYRDPEPVKEGKSRKGDLADKLSTIPISGLFMAKRRGNKSKEPDAPNTDEDS